MSLSATARALAPSALLFLVMATFCPSPTPLHASEEVAFGQPVAKTPSDLLQLYQKALIDDPDGSVQQRRTLGSLGLLEAVETSLAKSLALTTQKEVVNIAEGQYQGQSGTFDLMLAGGVNYGLNATKLDSVMRASVPYRALDANQATTSLAVSKQLRIGPAVSLSSQLLRNNYTDDLMATYAGTANPKTTAIVKLETKIPLLNGAGHFAASAETASQLSYEAAQYDYLQAISQTTLAVVQGYWDYRAAFFAYDVNLSMEGLIKKMLDREQGRAASPSARGLDSAQQSIVLSTLRAKLADASSDTSQARQKITVSRQALALALGIEPANFGKMAVPSDDFNLDGIALREDEAAYLNHLTETAMAHRPDLKSLTLKVKAAEVLVDRAKNNLKPRLDLVGSVGYTGLDEESGVGDYLSSATDMKDGEAWAVGATFSYPLGNQGAKGVLLAQDSTKRISAIQQDSLVRQITSQLTVDIASLKHWVSSLGNANTAVAEYWQSLTTLMQTQIRSNSDLVNLLDLQEKLRDAAVNRSDTLNGFAKAIALARFNSGTLVGLAGEKTVINLEGLTTLP